MSRRRQPHRIPPPISHGSETLDSEIILHELPDDLGLLLWKTVRSIRLWAELPPERRSAAFTGRAHADRLDAIAALAIDPDLRESMETAASVLSGRDLHLEAVVTACRLIASWADQRAALGTALEFTQAAAMLMPTDAELVHTVAWLARRRGEFARAESWYRQAIAVARRTHDWISLAGSYLGLGATFLQRGSHSAARLTLVRGVRAATRHSLWEERALLSHELARVAMTTDRPAEAVRSGRAALEAYGAAHPRLPALAADLGVYWVRAGHYEEGGRVLFAMDPAPLDPPERLARASALALASASAGDVVAFDAAWREADELLRSPSLGRETAIAWLDLARAAAAVGDAERARTAVERASRSAEVRGETALRGEADDLLRRLSEESAPLALEVRKAPRELRRLAEDLSSAFTSSAEAA